MSAPLLYGKYQLLELIARGGMAEVYKAKSHGVEGFEKLVVIKRILPEYSRDASFVEMFINEAKISVTLSHANIVQVFDLGRSDDSYFIAMEYVHGVDLAELHARSQAVSTEIPIEIAVYMVSEVAKGLDYAHRRKDQDMQPLGIVHRDISPQNVLISYEGEVKITDFGIAWALGNARAAEETIKGKARYMAPEQARGDYVDRRADIFSLGVVLYEILSGSNPLRGHSEAEALELLRSGGYPALSEAAPQVPEELSTIVERAMAIDPEERQPDAGRLYEELVSFLYTTRRRVGVHDLAIFTQGLRDVERPKKNTKGVDRTLREAFAEAGGSTPKALYKPEATPVERPKTATSAKAAEEGSGARAFPTALWDATSIAWENFGNESTIDTASVMVELIEREGGCVVEARDYFGIGVFGLEHRDGRDTETAISCALKAQRVIAALREQSAPELYVGIGVHAGKLVLMPSGRPKEDQRYYSLVDTARSLAGRQPGMVVVSEEARRDGQDLYLYQPLGDGEWTVEGERPIAEVYGRFVGRRDELRRVGEQLAYSSRGSGSALFIVGDHGMGKTRLLHETRKRLAAGGHDFSWYQVRCAPHLQEIPFSSLTSMIRALLGIEETDPPEKVAEQVERLRELGLSADETSAIGTMLGVELDSTDERSSQLDREIRVALLHIATSLAKDRLTVLAWDSAEKMDKQTIDSLAALSHGATWSRVLVLLTCQPPIGSNWNIIANSHFLELGPLKDTDIYRLATSRLQTQNVPSELLEEISQKTAGNPLYVEEYVKALVASDAVQVVDDRVEYRSEVAEIELPKSLRGLLGARIERLDESLRGFIQRASVMHPRFSRELLAAVAETTVEETDQALEELWRQGIIEKTGREEFAFVNEMFRDVVYDSITYGDRKAIHRVVATELERLYADRLDEVYERLAEHYRECSQRDKAVDYLCYSGEKLMMEGAHKAAFWHFYRAIELFQTLPGPDHERLLELYQSMGECAVEAGVSDVALEKLRLGIELAETIGDLSSIVALLTLTGRLYEKANRFSDAHRHFSHALSISEELGDERVRRAVLGSIGEALSRNGEYRQATEYLEAALELARSAGEQRRETNILRELGLCWAARGQKSKASECIETATQVAAAIGDHLLECETLKFRGLINYMVRDDEGALKAFNAALEMAKEYGFSYESAANAHNIGDLQIRAGDYRAAFTALRFSHEVARQHGFAKLETLNMMLLGFIDAVTFRSLEGLQRIESALESAQDHGYTWDAIQATYFLGKACLAMGNKSRAKEALREAIRMGRATDSRLYVEDCQRLLDSIEKPDESD